MIVFNLRHYDDEKTVWLPETEEIESIDTQVAKDWNEVLNELGSAWERFFSWIQSEDKDRPNTQASEFRTIAIHTEASASISYLVLPPPQEPTTTYTPPPSGSRSSAGK